jgi:hypothetical protein
MRTYEAGLERDGDEIFLYVDAVADWNIGWGKKLYRHSDKPSGHKGGGGKGGGNNGNGVTTPHSVRG